MAAIKPYIAFDCRESPNARKISKSKTVNDSVMMAPVLSPAISEMLELARRRDM
jgi:hypothetical protein